MSKPGGRTRQETKAKWMEEKHRCWHLLALISLHCCSHTVIRQQLTLTFVWHAALCKLWYSLQISDHFPSPSVLSCLLLRCRSVLCQLMCCRISLSAAMSASVISHQLLFPLVPFMSRQQRPQTTAADSSRRHSFLPEQQHIVSVSKLTFIEGCTIEYIFLFSALIYIKIYFCLNL